MRPRVFGTEVIILNIPIVAEREIVILQGDSRLSSLKSGASIEKGRDALYICIRHKPSDGLF